MTSNEPLFIASAGSSPEVTAEIAGSKAAQLWKMARLGLDVPPAFVMPTTLCASINAGDDAALEALRQGLSKGIAWLEEATGRRFGDSRAPLLVSVRSGAASSMPGMLETILDVGLNDQTVHGLIRMSGNPRLAFDSFRRLVQGYGEVVDHVPGSHFEARLADMIRREGVASENDLDPEALERLTHEFRELALSIAGHALPEDPREQLEAAAIAVCRSWETPKAREYRRLNRFEALKGTAVTVQCMIFGNSGGSSGAGVAFSRNPATGCARALCRFPFRCAGRGCRLRAPYAGPRGTARGAFAGGGGNSSPRESPASKPRLAMRRMSNSPSRPASCIFSRPGRRSVRRARLCTWPSIWCMRA